MVNISKVNVGDELTFVGKVLKKDPESSADVLVECRNASENLAYWMRASVATSHKPAPRTFKSGDLVRTYGIRGKLRIIKFYDEYARLENEAGGGVRIAPLDILEHADD
jgi:hypothetical protein